MNLPCYHCRRPTDHGGCARCGKPICNLCYRDHMDYHEYKEKQ